MSMSAVETAKREAQLELAECEKEITAIKATVKSLQTTAGGGGGGGGGGPGSSSSSSPSATAQPDEAESASAGNSLTVVLLKVEGLADDEDEEESSAQKLSLSLQLSSPIEEGEISDVFDPALEEVPETMKATFRAVETNQATLTLTATTASEGTPIGSSEPLDLGPLTKIDAMNPKTEYVTELPVALVPEQNEEGAEDSSAPVEVACTVTIRLTFVPSQKDQLEELYELLNKATTRKTQAVGKLRQISVMASRQRAGAQQQMTTRSAAGQQPAVRAGFLNRTAPKKEPSKLHKMYAKYLGPETLWRRYLPLAKNYLIFAVTVATMHFKGHMLALPPPV